MPTGPVFVATQHQSVREAIGHAIERLRPDLEVVLVEPDLLQARILERTPSLVVCTQLTAVRVVTDTNWLLIPTEGENLAIISMLGSSLRLEEASLSELISVVDEAVRIQKMT